MLRKERASGNLPIPAGHKSAAKLPVGHETDILILVVPGYSLLSLGCLVEPLLFAQMLPATRHASVTCFDLDTSQADTASGLGLTGMKSVAALTARLESKPTPAAIFLCCGLDVPERYREPLRRVMRQSRRTGVPIYGIGAATWALAEIGLLPDRKGVVHWTSLSAFQERNLDSVALANLFQTDPHVSTCAGELAVLDFVIEFLRVTFGREVADMTCDRFLISRPRGGASDQPSHLTNRLRHAPRVVQQAVATMRENLEQPVEIAEIAEVAGVSQRQLERLFAQYLGLPPRRFYCDLQLALAWQLCEQTDMPLTEVAIASGFSSQSALSRKFKDRYRITPSEMRSRAR